MREIVFVFFSALGAILIALGGMGVMILIADSSPFWITILGYALCTALILAGITGFMNWMEKLDK